VGLGLSTVGDVMSWLWLLLPIAITVYLIVSALVEILGDTPIWRVRVRVNGKVVWDGDVQEIVGRYQPHQLEHPILLYQGDTVEVIYTETLRGTVLKTITHTAKSPLTMIWKQVDANIPPLPRALFVEGVRMEADGWVERSFPIGGYET
jgi:hypothetical protein